MSHTQENHIPAPGADEHLWTIAEAADRLGVSRRTLYRYIERHGKKIAKYMIERDGGIKVNAEGIEVFRAMVGSKSGKAKPPKPGRRESSPDVQAPPDPAADAKASTKASAQEDKTAPYIAALLSQVEDLREERNRLVREVDDFRDLAKRLQEERDRLLFETAEWRGLYGRIEDQRAMVVRQPASDTWISKAWKTITGKVSGS